MRNNEIGKELKLKKQDDYIDEYGNLKDKIRRTHDKNFTSRTSGCSMEWQQSEPSSSLTSSRRHKQKEVVRDEEQLVYWITYIDYSLEITLVSLVTWNSMNEYRIAIYEYDSLYSVLLYGDFDMERFSSRITFFGKMR
ncbi:hypothetical protein RhiirA4_488603 [Rhizophagus irregularis]|uniref:Uncharacterized protein n=1 Tax=Rhizophagus irregularis TaxID=588596 RepID=A0A2I1HTX5_9GLOM|nr:hypothetical protein RhiirA4_488603 [Rhizophagus irregularis]